MRSGARLMGSFAILLLLQAATAVVAIALLGRMSPVFERILRENVASAEAVEEMTLVLARPALDDTARARYRAALDRASRHVTEPEEEPMLAELKRLEEAALTMSAPARMQSLDALERLGRVNRRAMSSARDEAQRLGMAGAWAVTLLGLITLGVSFLAAMRTRRRILAPLAEIARVVAAHQAGERRQRCTASPGDGEEIARIGAALNDVLDHLERAAIEPGTHGLERAILLHVLDERAEPVVVVGASGELLAANRQAETLLASARGAALRASLRSGSETGASEAHGLVLRSSPIAHTTAKLYVLERPAPE